MAKVVIFGNSLTAELAKFYIETDTEHDVVAFTVEEKYLDGATTFLGLPIVSFEEVQNLYPSSDFMFFSAMTELKMNQVRARIYEEAKQKGYSFISYISSKATVLSNDIGENCFILENNTIQPFVKIGNNVVLWSGNHIGHHSEVGDHVFFTSHVVLSGRCIVKPFCFFGVNATIRDKATIGEGTLVAMGGNLTVQKTDDWSVWKGSPAKKVEGVLSHNIL